MRMALAGAAVAAAVAVAAARAQDAPEARQTFRAGVELITVDVTAVDRDGRPIEDLRAGDFSVKVDGRERDVVSAEFVRADGGPPAPPLAGPAATSISSNATVPGARRIAIAVDQSRIAPAAITPILHSASRFLDALTPVDSAAFLAFPEPGPRVDFTTDTDRVRRVMEEGIVGQASRLMTRTFGISLSEAVALDDKENIQAWTVDISDPDYQQRVLDRAPTLRRILERSLCDGRPFEEVIQDKQLFSSCVGQVRNESAAIAFEAQGEANVSLGRLESFLSELTLLEGPKTLVLISAGLFNDDLTALDKVARLAAAARTTVNVIAVDPASDQVEVTNEVAHAQGRTTLQDRQLVMNGLEVIADSTGGALYRGIGNARGVFDRLSSELSAWYVLGVERRPGDPEQQRVEVSVRRRGVSIRSNRSVIAASALTAGRAPDDLLRDALSSPVAISGVPLRVSTFVRHDEMPGRRRVDVAAQVGEGRVAAGEFAVGFVVIDHRNQVVSSLGKRQHLSPPPRSAGPLHFDASFVLDPGTYSVRVGVVAPDGRRGTVVHSVEVPAASAAAPPSDLIVGNVPPAGEALRPTVEPHVSGLVAAYLELPASAGAELEVTLEIAEGDASPALASQPLEIRNGPAWRVASGALDAPLAPGRYLARARVRRGDTTIAVVSRPFVLEPGGPAATAPPARERAAPASPELRQRTGTYITGVVSGLSNIVGREEFVLTDPDRRVTSDILLVRYPGSERDFLVYRDVSHVDGTPLPDRQERLADLFLKPVTGLRERARKISLDGEAHVPSALNPLFVLGFLQSDFQPRFELTVRDAGPEWPREVKAVGFVERARPTMLRAGPLGNVDVPASGTAWIEEATGRVVQTELRLGSGRSAPAVVTRFRLDERLQIVVPETMRTRNPDGVATYSGFRRFSVQTDSAVSDPR